MKCPETLIVDFTNKIFFHPEPCMNKKSKNREQKRALRRELVKKIMATNPTCKAVNLDIGECWGPLDVDEIVLRSQLKDAELIEENCQVLCRKHHQWKHENPSKARELGLYRSAWENK